MNHQRGCRLIGAGECQPKEFASTHGSSEVAPQEAIGEFGSSAVLAAQRRIAPNVKADNRRVEDMPSKTCPDGFYFREFWHNSRGLVRGSRTFGRYFWMRHEASCSVCSSVAVANSSVAFSVSIRRYAASAASCSACFFAEPTPVP